MIEETWDLMAVDYDGFTNKASSYSNAIEWPAVKAMLPRLEDKEILDVGCGTGRFTFYLNEFQPKSSIGIDISAKMIEIANGKNPTENIRFIKCSALDITKTLKKKFDFIFLRRLLITSLALRTSCDACMKPFVTTACLSYQPCIQSIRLNIPLASTMTGSLGTRIRKSANTYSHGLNTEKARTG